MINEWWINRKILAVCLYATRVVWRNASRAPAKLKQDFNLASPSVWLHLHSQYYLAQSCVFEATCCINMLISVEPFQIGSNYDTDIDVCVTVCDTQGAPWIS